MPSERWLAGYRIKVVNGDHLASTERRLGVLQDCPAEPLPAQSLVVLEPETRFVVQMVGCGNGHAQERNLLEPVLAEVQSKDVYIAVRNLGPLSFLSGAAEREGASWSRSMQSCPSSPRALWCMVDASRVVRCSNSPSPHPSNVN